jgi:uncharacterized protein (TIRG00374 family)
MKKFWIKMIVSVGIGALFIWLAIGSAEVKWVDVKQALSHVELSYIIFYLLILSIIHLIRVLRWGILLKPLAKIEVFRLFSAALAGMMALMLLPLRLGEFARPILISERGKIRISAALGTVVVERVVDSLAMASLLVIVLFFIQEKTNMQIDLRYWSWVIFLGFMFLLLFLVLAYRKKKTAISWTKRVLAPLPKKFSRRAISMLDSFIGGLEALPNIRLLAGFLFLTFVYWFLAGFGMWVVFSAFNEMKHMGLLEGFAALSVLCVGLMIPAGPGMVGNFHYFILIGLSLFLSEQVVGTVGMAYAIIIHASNLAIHVLFGIPFLFTSQISFKQILEEPSDVAGGIDTQGATGVE